MSLGHTKIEISVSCEDLKVIMSLVILISNLSRIFLSSTIRYGLGTSLRLITPVGLLQISPRAFTKCYCIINLAAKILIQFWELPGHYENETKSAVFLVTSHFNVNTLFINLKTQQILTIIAQTPL